MADLYGKPMSWFLSTVGPKQEAELYVTNPKLAKVVRRLAELPAVYQAVVEGVIEKLEGLPDSKREKVEKQRRQVT